MTPSIITLISKYELNSNETDNFLKRIYDNCNSELNSTKSYIASSYGIASTTPYKDYPQNLRIQMLGELNRIIQSISQYSNFEIPQLTDKSGVMKFSMTNVNFEIDDSNGLIFNLLFKTELMTLIGNINNTLILALGDKLKLLENNVDINVFCLEYGNNIWISTYRK